MGNITTTPIDTGGVELHSGEFRDDVLTFGSADAFPAGTILARHTGTGKLQIYAKGGSSNGNGIPRCVLTYDVDKDASGDLSLRAMFTGVVNKKRLIIDADGDDANIDATVLDLLQDIGIVAIDVDQIGLTPEEEVS